MNTNEGNMGTVTNSRINTFWVKFFLPLAIVGAIVVSTVILVTGGNTTKNAVVESYVTFFEEVYNHGKTVEELDALNAEVVEALASDEETGHNRALQVLLENGVPVENVFVDSSNVGDVETRVEDALNILLLMISNSSGEQVDPVVDASRVIVEGEIASIPLGAITFMSDGDGGALLNVLEEKKELDDGSVSILLFLSEDGWKVDLETFAL